MSNSKIARQSYQRARQGDLSAFAENIYKRMHEQAAFADLQPLVTALAAPMARYAEALAKSQNRGRAELLAKNGSRKELVGQLDLLAKALEEFSGGDAQMIVDVGFLIYQPTGLRYPGVLPPPTLTRVSSTGKRGELRIVLEDAFPRAVRTHAVEYSLDRGQTWTNGAYHSHRNFLVNGLPHSAELWLHVKSVGKGSSKSSWSEPVTVAVL